MQHEITHVIPLLDEHGNLTEPGYAKKLLPVYRRKDVRAGKSRIKEWDYYLISNGRFALALTVADNGYMGMDSVSLLDLEEGWEITKSPMNWLPFGKLPQNTLVTFIMGLGCLLMVPARSMPVYLIATFFAGFSSGFNTALNPMLCAEYLGNNGFSMIFGVINTVAVVAGLGTPIMAMAIYNSGGSYKPAYVIVGAMLAAIGLLSLRIKPFRAPAEGHLSARL